MADLPQVSDTRALSTRPSTRGRMIPRLSLGEQYRSGTQTWVQLDSRPATLTEVRIAANWARSPSGFQPIACAARRRGPASREDLPYWLFISGGAATAF